MNIEKIKQFLEDENFRKYKPSSIESYDEAWQFTLGDGEFINANLYLWEDKPSITPGFEILHYKTYNGYVSSTTYYAFDTEKDLKKVVKLLKPKKK